MLANLYHHLKTKSTGPTRSAYLYEFLLFGIKQAWACLFGGLLLAMILGTRFYWPEHFALARYDALFVGALLIQAALIGFGLETFFIWLAENIGTFGAIWLYPQQQSGWQMVSFAKMGSWFLLMIISVVLVTLVHPPREVADQGVNH